MFDIALLSTLFLVGLNGSLHCVGMCGPIVGLLGMNTDVKGGTKKVGTAFCYNLGRITTYVLLGFVAMILSIAMNDLKPLQIIVRYFAGIIMFFVGLQLLGFPQFLAFLERPFQKLSRPVSGLTRKFFPIKTLKGAYIAGMAWGLLPCGMVYMAFAMSLGAEGLLGAPLGMLLFGLGTLPMMLTLSVSGNFFGSFFTSPGARKISGILVLIMTIFYMGSMIMGDLGLKGGHSMHGHGADHSSMNHDHMDHSSMNHSSMDHGSMNRSETNHSEIHEGHTTEHEANGHSSMMNHNDHESQPEEGKVDHSTMDHQMNH